MIFVSVTRLRVRRLRFLIPFFKANEASAKQLLATPGFLTGKELIDKHFTFWTLTAWADATNMKQFRNGDAHRFAMQQLPHWCDEAAYAHWQQDNTDLPSWQKLYAKIISEGVFTKVRNPCANHLNKYFPPPKWKRLERNFKGLHA